MEPKPYLSVEEYLEACAKRHDTARITATVEALLTELQAEAIKRDNERREKEHDLHMQFMEKQLKGMDEDREYRACIREQTIRQTAALERVVALLERLKP